MAFNTYADLKTSIANWIDDSGLTSFLDDFIDLAEERLARDVRIWGIESALSGTTSSGVLAVPADFLELKHAYVTGNPVRPLDQREAWWIHRQFPNRTSESKPYFIAIDAGNFIFGPVPDADYDIEGTYYAKPTALSSGNTTNAWTTYCPDLLLWACMIEAEEFVKDFQSAQMWQSKYVARLSELNGQDKKKIRRNARVMQM